MICTRHKKTGVSYLNEIRLVAMARSSSGQFLFVSFDYSDGPPIVLSCKERRDIESFCRCDGPFGDPRKDKL